MTTQGPLCPAISHDRQPYPRPSNHGLHVPADRQDLSRPPTPRPMTPGDRTDCHACPASTTKANKAHATTHDMEEKGNEVTLANHMASLTDLISALPAPCASTRRPTEGIPTTVASMEVDRSWPVQSGHMYRKHRQRCSNTHCHHWGQRALPSSEHAPNWPCCTRHPARYSTLLPRILQLLICHPGPKGLHNQ